MLRAHLPADDPLRPYADVLVSQSGQLLRGYLTGSTSTSIWTAYEKGLRSYCGHELEDGMQRHEKLPEPLLTPTTKADFGQHDELTSREELIQLGAISEEHYDRAAQIAKKLFTIGQAFAESRGLILVDTKYEMGLDENGNIIKNHKQPSKHSPRQSTSCNKWTKYCKKCASNI